MTYPPGFIPAKLVLIQGVHHAAGDLKLIVNPWKFHGISNNLPELISESTLEGLVISLFDDKPEEINASSGELIYFNQVSGPKHPRWFSSVLVMEHENGSKYFESAPTQDN